MLPSVAGASIAGTVAAVLLAVLALRSISTLLHLAAPAVLVAVAVWMFVSERYERTLAVLALYLGLLDGFLKLKTGSSIATLGRDLLLYAIAGGALLRLILSRERVRMPKLALGVALWVVICLAQVLNPVVPSIAHAVAGIRQHIEFVPLFFMGYAVMRSERRLLGLFALMLVVAAVNGAVSLVQSHLTPVQLASWGPGYAADILGTAAQTGRTFVDAAGGTHIRPPALGSDLGFGGVVAAMALPGALALGIAAGHRRRYLPALVVGVVFTVLGLATSQSRTAVLSAAIGVAVFLLLAVTSRRGVTTALVTVGLGVVAYFGVSVLFGGALNGANRYSSIAPTKAISTTLSYRQSTLALIPTYIVDYPLGAGIGEKGPAGASAVGGRVSNKLNAESEPTFLILELGIPGLIAMSGLMFAGIRLGVRLRTVRDHHLQCALAAVTAGLVVQGVSWIVGVNTANSPTAPFMWLALGTLAFWGGLAVRDRVAIGRRWNGMSTAPRDSAGDASSPESLPRGAATRAATASARSEASAGTGPASVLGRVPASALASAPAESSFARPTQLPTARGVWSATARLGLVSTGVLVLGVVTGPLQARALGPAGRGDLAAITVIATLTPWICGFGLGAFAAREVARGRPVREVFVTVGGSLFLLGLCLAPVGFVMADVLAPHKPAVRLFVIVTFCLLPLSLPAVALNYVAVGMRDWRRVNATRMLAAGGMAVAIVVLYITGSLTVMSGGAAMLASSVVAIIPVTGALRTGGPWTFSGRVLRRSFRFGLRAWVGDIASLSNARLDQLLMVGLVSSRQLGLYAVGVSAAALSGIIPAALGLPVLTQTATSGADQVAKHVRIILALGVVVAGVGAVGFAVVIPLAFGHRFAGAVPISWVLLGGAIPLGGVVILSAAFTGHGAPGIPAAAEVVTLIITVAGLVILLPLLGALGAAVVSVVAYTANFGIQCGIAPRRFGGRFVDYALPRPRDAVTILQAVATRARIWRAARAPTPDTLEPQ